MKEILSPEEISALLARTDDEETDDSVGIPEGRFNPKGLSVRPFDFQRQRCLTERASQELIERHHAAMEEFSRVLDSIIGVRSRWKIHECQFVNRADLKAIIDNSSIKGIWTLAPRFPKGIIEWENTWGHYLLEKFLGGSRGLARENSTLTGLEAALFRKVIVLLFGVLKRTWGLTGRVFFEPGEITGDASFVEASAGFEAAVSVTLEVIYDETKIGYVRMFYPSEGLTMLIRLAEHKTRIKPEVRVRNGFARKFYNVNLPLRVEMARKKIGLRDLAALRRGDTIVFGQNVREAVKVKINGIPKFTGIILDPPNCGRLRIRSKLD